MNKIEKYNKSVHNIIRSAINSLIKDQMNLRYLHIEYQGHIGLKQYDVLINKAKGILNRGLNYIKEDELYFVLSNLSSVWYNDKYVAKELFIERLINKIAKLPKDSLNNDHVVLLLKNAKFLHLYGK